MLSPELEREIIELRAHHLTPRQIALYLGLRVAEVRDAIASRQEEILALAREAELPPVAKCLVNRICAERLLDNIAIAPDPTSSLGLVLVARFQGFDRFQICTYLVDYFCLGVKDTMGPRLLDKERYPYFVRHAYESFPDGWREITLEEAQAIVYGSVYYASRLGFQPSASFEESQGHLGKWEKILQLQFGREGRPLYINGPYDNPRRVIKTLEQKVGRGNFDYILGIG